MSEIKDVLLLQLDHAWDHPWESVQSSLKDVSEEMSSWQHESFRGEEREANWPLPGTILWQLAHLANCKRHYTEMIKIRPNEPAEFQFLPRERLGDALESLAQFHRELRTAIAALTASELNEKVSNGQTLVEFITMMIRHDAWHASQIKIAQR